METDLASRLADTLSTQELLKILHTPHGSAEARESAAEALYQRYNREVMWFIQGKVADRDDQLDIHAEVWKFIYEHLRRFTWRSQTVASDPFRSWIFAIAKRKVLEHLRGAVVPAAERLDAQLSYMDTYDTLEGFEIEYPALHPGKQQQELDQLLRGALAALKEIERKVILLTYFNNKNSTEIGAMLRISPGNVRVHRNRAIKQMRAFFRRQ
jgi:RNA polymerase sigma factor (sigma-70 family)